MFRLCAWYELLRHCAAMRNITRAAVQLVRLVRRLVLLSTEAQHLPAVAPCRHARVFLPLTSNVRVSRCLTFTTVNSRPCNCILPTRPLNMCWVLTTAFILPSIRPEHGRHSGHQCPRAVSNMGTEAIKTHSQNAKYRRRVLIPFTQLSTVNWKTSVLKMIAVTPSFASFWLLVVRRHGLWMRWHCYCHVIQTGFS